MDQAIRLARASSKIMLVAILCATLGPQSYAWFIVEAWRASPAEASMCLVFAVALFYPLGNWATVVAFAVALNIYPWYNGFGTTIQRNSAACGVACVVMFLALAAMDARLRRRQLLERFVGDGRPPVLFLRSASIPHLSYERAQTKRTSFSGHAFKYVSRSMVDVGICVGLSKEWDGDWSNTADNYLEVEVAEAHWHQLVARLIEACMPIVVIPELSDGVAREIGFLCASGHWRKMLLLMPPTREGSRTEHIAPRWEAVREAWRASGYSLPAYDQAGMIYAPNDDLSIRESWSLTDWTASVAVRVVNNMRADRRLIQEPSREIARELRVVIHGGRVVASSPAKIRSRSLKGEEFPAVPLIDRAPETRKIEERERMSIPYKVP